VLNSDWNSDILPGLLKDMAYFAREAAFQGELADQLASAASTEVQGLGMFVVQLETPLDQFDTVRQLLQVQLRALADTPVSADELQGARQPVIEGWRGVQQQNAFWAGVLRGVLAHDRHKGAVLGIADHLQAVTPARIQAYFRDHIARRPPIEVQARGASRQPASTPSAP
jgi:zinc protease